MEEKYHITVNHNKCVGSQICILLDPDIFKLNEVGQSIIISVDGDAEHINHIADQCPQSAIIVEKYETSN
jgi:ferredoxin|tara:strand:+ start:484 stop:693 length:210 start_codon:yes stop_codon:yes gene_type:complete